jgi:hypothetical protein
MRLANVHDLMISGEGCPKAATALFELGARRLFAAASHRFVHAKNHQPMRASRMASKIG